MEAQVSDPSKDWEDRIARTKQIYVSNPQQDQVLARIERCRVTSRGATEPDCVLIRAPSGWGKTTVIDLYKDGHPAVDLGDRTKIPVLAATVPASNSVMAMAATLLQALGDPHPDRGRKWQQTDRLIRFLKQCEVELIILDEFQHFMEFGDGGRGSRILRDVADWLKNLINLTGIPIVLVGLPYADRILEENHQLQRRFSSQVPLAPYKWGTPKQQADFRSFLDALDNLLPLPQRSGLSDASMAFRLHAASRGLVGVLMKIVRRATIIAIENGRPKLTQKLLAEAYQDQVARTAAGLTVNPFRVQKDSLREALRQALEKKPEVTKKNLKASDVLSRS